MSLINALRVNFIVTDGINPMYHTETLYHHIVTHCDEFRIMGAYTPYKKNRYSAIYKNFSHKIPANKNIVAEDVKEPEDYNMPRGSYLTAGELITALKEVPENSPVRFQWIEDRYITGMNERSTFHGEAVDNPITNMSGWKTYDMSCDGDCIHNIVGDINDKEVQRRYCSRCPWRNRYITATRCFKTDNMVFIDGHW